MEKKNSVFCILFLMFFTCIVTETIVCKEAIESSSELSEFVIKKKKKKKGSKSKLQKEACQIFADQMNYGLQMNKNTADIGQILLEETIKYIQSEKDGVLIKNKRDNLSEIVKTAQKFQEKLEQFCKECEQYVVYLNGQKQSVS